MNKYKIDISNLSVWFGYFCGCFLVEPKPNQIVLVFQNLKSNLTKSNQILVFSLDLVRIAVRFSFLNHNHEQP